MKTKLIALLSVLALVLAACGGDDAADETTTTTEAETTTTTEAEMESNTIVDIAAGNEDFSTLVTAVQEAGLVDTLSSEGPFTVFAPTNAAFDALPEGALDAVLADQELLTAVLTYHVVAGEVPAADVVELDSATTVEGSDVEITVDGDNVMVDDANVVTTDIEASNGIIHVIDAVLLPQVALDALSGDAMGEEDMDGDMSADAMNIVETAEAAGDFTTLLAAVEAAGLTETLATGGPFTVFAPTDEAFAAVGEETLNGLLEDPEALSEVLLYHVVEGEVYAADVVELESATTVQGSDVEIMVDGDTVMINGATVVMTDIVTANGVIHVIDAVLLPPSS